MSKISTMYSEDASSVSIEDQGIRSANNLRSEPSNDSGIFPMIKSMYDESQIDSLLYLTILDETIDQIHMLNGGFIPDKKLTYYMRNLKERIGENFIREPLYDTETGEEYNLAFLKRKQKKLLNDSAQLQDFLVTIRNELKETLGFKFSQSVIDSLIENVKEENQLLKDVEENYEKLLKLRKTLPTESKFTSQRIAAASEKLAALKDETQAIYFENLICSRYVREWEKARYEQNILSNQRKETELALNVIAHYRMEIEKELRVTTEIALYILNSQKDLEKDIEHWKDKYETDAEKTQLDIQLTNEKWDELSLEHSKLKELYEKHKKSIKDFLNYKDQKRQAEEQEELLNKMATKIGAWWRGVMVRNKLGPYNPNYKKKDTKKGKKGKKGGKKK